MEPAVLPFILVLFFGLVALACCLISAFDPSKRDQKLYRLHYRL